MSYQSITADVVKLGDHLPAVSAGEVSNGSVKKPYPKCLHIMTFVTDYIYRTFSEIRSRKHCISLHHADVSASTCVEALVFASSCFPILSSPGGASSHACWFQKFQQVGQH